MDKDVTKDVARDALKKPMSDEQKMDLASDYFAEDWAIDKAIKLIEDYEWRQGIKP